MKFGVKELLAPCGKGQWRERQTGRRRQKGGRPLVLFGQMLGTFLSTILCSVAQLKWRDRMCVSAHSLTLFIGVTEQ